MRIHLIQYNDTLPIDSVFQKVVVVIDVFRATSVIITALSHGAKQIIPAATVQEAVNISNNFEKNECILGGERKMLGIEGFDRDNSPFSYMHDVRNKTIILTTTNGTRALHFCRKASEVYISSFHNAEQVARALAAKTSDVNLICSGLQGKFALEDACCAGKIIDLMMRFHDYEMDAYGICIRSLYRENAGNIKSFISGSSAYKALRNTGAGRDADFCLKEDLYPVIPIFNTSTLSITLTAE